MLRYIYGSNLHDHPVLADTMFRDRGVQFRDRLGWDVSVDAQGHERDEYDGEDPLYVIWQRPDGRHGGSMRFLPTTGPTMVNDHFADLSDGAAIRSPLIWESTRFCLAPNANSRIAAALMLGGGEVMRGFGVTQFVGVFDARMVRIYRRVVSSPTVLGSSETGRDKISVGLWTYNPSDRVKVLWRAGLSSALSHHWYARAFGEKPEKMLARAA
ncbi:putative acyl-homoserine-lactone synthase [Octadecabacter antarcticus 307]|uniref:Acyl-homoserine-lactone synthase n=1 Tax=Octadecabacter antarcticus 307 TaxID=391626 RepID=M9RI80_9RHOB|nr:acyl-homoserine-lactone synthase [Octadecabacter antarcticus]AGI69530.1 putative acyl-homoserine-lactone synthase [Octadecabacter antarcticus 307]